MSAQAIPLTRERAAAAYQRGWWQQDQIARGLPLPQEGARFPDAGWDRWFRLGESDRRQGRAPRFDELWETWRLIESPPEPAAENLDEKPPASPPPVVVSAPPVAVSVSQGPSWWLVGALTAAAFGGGFLLARRSSPRASAPR